MLNRFDLKAYRILRELSYREVANYCNTSHTMIMDVEKGVRGMTKETHDDILRGINTAYGEKIKGTLKAKNTKKVANPEPVAEEQDKKDKKSATTKK